MTANQINYFKAREDVRSHLAQERLGERNAENSAEANRINLIRSGIEAQNATTNSLLAQVKQYEAVEQARANQAREYETQRHNIATENETLRYNTAMESIRNAELYEGIRSNMASEQIRQAQNFNDAMRIEETRRSNLVAEGQKEAQLWQNTREQKETERHNAVVEKQTALKDYRAGNKGAFEAVTNFVGKVVPMVANFLMA